MKRIGPRTDPWGTPQVTVCCRDLALPSEMYSVLLVRYDLNQLRAVSVIPVVWCRRFRSMPWSTVSKAADRSSSMRSDGEPASAVIRRSFVTLTRAVSVLWAWRKPDWNFSKRLLCLRCSFRWAATAFSSTLERNGRLEMGL